MKNYLFLLSIGLLISTASTASVEDKHETPKEYLENKKILIFNAEENENISRHKDKYFSALVFKEYIESNKNNFKLRQKVQNYMNNGQLKKDNLKEATIVINMGLGWDADNYSQQPYYVKNFIDEIKLLGNDVIFLSRFPYAPMEQNIESIKPQLKHILRNKKVILLSLCKGSPELLVSSLEIVRENPEMKKNILGILNMSGMMAGTFFSTSRFDLELLTSIEFLWDKYIPTKNSFSKYDRRQTVWSLPFMRKNNVIKLVNSVSDVNLDPIPVINVSGILTSDKISKRDTPLKMFISYNQLTDLYPNANDGFLDITETRFPSKNFSNQSTLLLESSHLLADGYFNQTDLMIKENRIKFYQALYQTLVDKINESNKRDKDL